jgi:hypothetical protein
MNAMSKEAPSKNRRRSWPPLVTPDYLAELRRLGRLQCTPSEIASILDYTVPAIVRSLRGGKPLENYELGRVIGAIELREAQFKLAATSTPMAKLLGKLYLNQGERLDGENNAAAEIAAGAQRVRDMLAAIAAEDNSPEGGGEGQEAK